MCSSALAHYDIRTPLRGTKRAKYTSTNLKPQPAPPLPTSRPPKYRTDGGRASSFQFVYQMSTFLRLQNLRNFGSLSNAPRSQKLDFGTFLAPILIICWIPFGINFLYISWLPENCCFATSIIRNSCFTFNTFHFGIQINSKTMFFQGAFLDILFDYLMLISCENCRFGDPFKIS